METPERLERLLHEILHNLQVIRMEAELRKKARSERISLGVLDATKDIEKLLEEVKTKFHALSIKLAVKAPGNGHRTFYRADVRTRGPEHPDGKEWLYEVKFDDYRCLAGRDKNGVTLWSHRGNLFTSQFPLITRACERLSTDGEIVAIDKNGRISFNLLQYHGSHAQALLFYAFDVIVCQGKSLLNTPLEKRRTLLNEIFADLGKNASPVCLSERIDATPAELIGVAKEVGFEEVLAKRRALFTNRVSVVARGSSTASTKGKSLSLAHTSPTTHSIRSLLATTKTESYFMLPRCGTGSCQTPASALKVCRPTPAPLSTYQRKSARNGR
jgi:hypothetical protein